MRSATFYLEVSPTTNNLFVNRGKVRKKSNEYNSWTNNALKELLVQRAKPVPPPVALTIELPESLRGDLSNRIKAAEDLLVRAGIIPDDSKRYVRSVTASFYEGKRMRITVQSLVGDA